MTADQNVTRKLPPPVAAIITIAIVLAVGIWAYKATSGDWAAVAAVVQAAVATALVWATYSSIQRSDQQVAVALEQVRVAQQQLGYGSVPNLIVEFNPLADANGNLSLDFINLSTFAIHVARVEAHGALAYPFIKMLSLPNRTIAPSSHVSGMLMEEMYVSQLDSMLTFTDFDDTPDKERNQFEKEDVRQAFPLSEIHVEYFYGPTGDRAYRIEYQLELYRMPKTVAIERYWTLVLRPSQKMVRLGDGSWKPTATGDHHGNWRPSEYV